MTKRAVVGAVVLLAVALCGDDAAAKRRKVELFAAVELGLVTVVEARGAGLGNVNVTLKASVDVKVTIRSGSLFDTKAGAKHQRMVVTHTQKVKLDAGESKTVLVRTACANFHRKIPRESDRFHLARAPKDLRYLVRCLETKKISHSQRQIAVWILTDKVDRKQLASRSEMTDALCEQGKRRHRLLGKERCKRLMKRVSGTLLEELMRGGQRLVKGCQKLSGSAKDALKKGIKRGVKELRR